MLEAEFLPKKNKAMHILCLGAHCDDIEIGCGGSLLTIIRNNPQVCITWVVLTSNELRKKEAEHGVRLFTAGAEKIEVDIYNFRDGFLPYIGGEVKEVFEQLKSKVNPDIIFTHYRNDLHQDHRTISELTWNTFRNHMILEYEIPKWDGDLGVPNTFITIDQDIGKRKIDYLQQAYNTQQTKKWFTDDLFWSLMRLRGMESNAKAGIAEGFYTRKLVLNCDFTVY